MFFLNFGSLLQVNSSCVVSLKTKEGSLLFFSLEFKSKKDIFRSNFHLVALA